MNMKHIVAIIIILSAHVGQVKSQSDALVQTVVERLYGWHSLAPVEKLYVHQDRTHYLAGDTIWFKVYQSFSKEIQAGSGVVYVDLIDGSNSYVTQTKWKLEDGMSAGQIQLPDTLPTGSYQLRAYTRWMQNFDFEGFFTREISVSSPIISNQKMSPAPERRLTLFPEGGNLAAGLLSRIAFEATDANGKGIAAKGFISDTEGNLICEFETEYAGMGFFNFIPEAGKEYIAKLAGSDMAVPFPEIHTQGAVLSTYSYQDQFRITLRHNLDNNKAFYVTIHRNGTTYFNGVLDLKQETVIADIPLSKLPVGIFTVTIYDESCYAWCERLCLANYPEQLNLKITTDKDTYGRREKVTLQIEAMDSDGNPQSGNFSMAVVKAGLDNLKERNNFLTDCFLQSELRGRIYNPSFFLDKVNYKELDLLLMTHGWRRYAWNEIVMGNQPSLYFPIEKGLSFSGRVALRNRRQNPENVKLTAFFRHDSINEGLSTKPAFGGYFRFEGYDFADTAEVILSARDNRQVLNVYVITHPDPQPEYYSYTESVTQEENDFLLVEIFGEMPKIWGDMENTIYQLPEIMVTSRVRKNRDPRSRHDPAFADYIYKVTKDFSYGSHGALGILQRMNMFALKTFNNIIMGGSGTSQGGFSPDYLTRIISGNSDNVFILDGYYVSAEELSSFPASLIERVEILSPSTAMIYGGRRIFFFTRSQEDKALNLEVKTEIYRFAGYNQQKEFYVLDYSIPHESYRQDIRKTLYWQPYFKLDNHGKGELSFYTSDDKSEYVIHCEGRSDMGMVGVLSNTFNIY